VVKFSQPAPITQISNEAKAVARNGFAPGDPRSPSGGNAGNYVQNQPPLSVEPPSTSTTSTSLLGF
jgi:hypothetical protein